MEPEYPLTFVSLSSGVTANTLDIKIITGLIILMLLLLASALISGSEVAFFSFRPDDLEKLKNNRSKKAQAALKLYKNPETLLSTILVANNTINITIVLLAAFISSRIFDFSSEPLFGFILNVVVITFLLLLFGEIMPKVYATRNHIGMALFMAYPITVLKKVFKPVTSLLIFSSSFVKKRSGAKRSNISMDDLSDALELTSDELNEDDKILKGIVNFSNINVSAIMCPRIDVTAIDINTEFDIIVSVIIKSGFSRIPVYSDSFDSVKGILYAKDVLPYTDKPSSFKWQSLLRPPYFVPETKKINDLLKEFQSKRMHMAVVIDEYGGTSGIITLEDILEEIVGEITDESDEDQLLFRKINDNTYIFEGKILLNDFCKVFEIEEDIFEEVRGESETLAGLILELKGEIPVKNQTIEFGKFVFRILSADRRRIKEIQVEIKEDESEIQEG
ncbi:MAG: gliding motility-associated protein GldE [Candidatus Theseobacter exili]|nr:gliding motility-associated protein GldE [Candidatus Theseobacter exili]